MNPDRNVNVDSWPIAKFPSPGLREEFLGQVRLWNSLEDIPKIAAVLLNDGLSVRFFGGEAREKHVHKLIDAYGGRIQPARETVRRSA